MEERMTGDFERSPRFFGLFTWADLLRLGLPPGVLLWLVDLGALPLGWTLAVVTVGGLLGLTWYLLRPYGDPLEVYLFHVLR